MTPASREMVHSLGRRIGEHFRPHKVILFGSYAWGTPGPDSDADFFVITETENTRESARAMDAYLWGRTIPVDIIVSTPERVTERLAKGDMFIKDIMEKGSMIYERHA